MAISARTYTRLTRLFRGMALSAVCTAAVAFTPAGQMVPRSLPAAVSSFHNPFAQTERPGYFVVSMPH